jgi:hypothetical protein
MTSIQTITITRIQIIMVTDHKYLVTDGATTGAGAIRGMILDGGIVRGVEMTGITGTTGAIGGSGSIAMALGGGGARMLTAIAG